MNRPMRRSVLGVLALAAALIFGQLALATPSQAYSWSSRVDLGGKASCISPTARVTKVELWVRRNDTRTETYHNASLDNGRYQRRYSARLSVPGAGVNVWAKVTCGGLGSYWTNFGVKRPTVGYGTTRNLCPKAGLSWCI